MVEPVAGGVLSAAAVMIFVVVEAVVPESQLDSSGDIARIATVLGFATMMILDVPWDRITHRCRLERFP